MVAALFFVWEVEVEVEVEVCSGGRHLIGSFLEGKSPPTSKPS